MHKFIRGYRPGVGPLIVVFPHIQISKLFGFSIVRLLTYHIKVILDIYVIKWRSMVFVLRIYEWAWFSCWRNTPLYIKGGVCVYVLSFLIVLMISVQKQAFNLQ